MNPHDQLNDKPPATFRSSDIKGTKAGERTNYFIKTKDNATSRRIKRRAKIQAIKERHHQKALSRRQYLKEWLKIYRAPIAIVFLVIIIIAIILGIIIAISIRPKSSTTSITEINSSMSEDELASALTKVFAEEGTDVGLSECERLLPTLSSSPNLQASMYLHCASLLAIPDDETYYSAIFRYAYAAEDLLHSYDTAKVIANYETLYGSPEKGDEYNLIAAERDPSRASEDNTQNPEGDESPSIENGSIGEIESVEISPEEDIIILDEDTEDTEDLPEDTSELIITDVQEGIEDEWTEGETE